MRVFHVLAPFLDTIIGRFIREIDDSDIQPILDNMFQAGRDKIVSSVIIFGSRARGNFKPDSDWDVFVAVDGSEDEAWNLGGRLKNLKLDGNPVNYIVRSEKLVHLPPISEYFQYIRREGITLYGKPVSEFPEGVYH